MERKLVIPGQSLGEGKAGSGAYEENGQVYSKVLGLADKKGEINFVIPLVGIYNPKKGDGIVGKIEEIAFSHWVVNFNSPYRGFLPLNEAVTEFVDLTKTDITKYYDYGDIVFAEISNVTKNKNVQLSMKSRKCRKLYGGRLISVTATKVPRIIGKGGSMVELIKKATGCQIVVGQNGVVWIKGENEKIAVETIQKIEEQSHVSGLTDQVKQMLEERTGKKLEDIENLEEGE